jgi:hypothetical protein
VLLLVEAFASRKKNSINFTLTTDQTKTNKLKIFHPEQHIKKSMKISLNIKWTTILIAALV